MKIFASVSQKITRFSVTTTNPLLVFELHDHCLLWGMCGKQTDTISRQNTERILPTAKIQNVFCLQQGVHIVTTGL